jgi:hypothetical protein
LPNKAQHQQGHKGLRADIIAVQEYPSKEIKTERIIDFIMKADIIYK